MSVAECGGTAWVALGSNLGDRADTLRRALERLTVQGVEVKTVSHLYATRPEHGAREPEYLNAVARVLSAVGPRDLLGLLLSVERELGRTDRREGPRACDLDLLAFGDRVVHEPPELVVPHPRLHRRAFVLVPLCEIDVHWRHPVLGRTSGELLACAGSDPGEVRLHGPLRSSVPGSSEASAGAFSVHDGFERDVGVPPDVPIEPGADVEPDTGAMSRRLARWSRRAGAQPHPGV